MKTKTITKVIDKKITEWLESITDVELRKEAKRDLIVTGKCIASMFLKENVNDFDLEKLYKILDESEDRHGN